MTWSSGCRSHDEFPAIAIEATCRNVSGRALAIHSMEPVRAVEREGGVLHAPGVSRCLTSGEMYFDTGILHDFGTRKGAITSGKLKGVTLANGPIGYVHFRDHDSYSLKLVHDNIIEVRVRFDGSDEVPWKIDSESFFR